MKPQFIIYAGMESLLEKIDTCQNNPENSSTTKKNKHTASGHSLLTHSSLDARRNKHNYYRGKDCMKNFCKDFKKQTTKITNYEKNDTINK